MTTVHANPARDALRRLETMVLMAGYDLPLRAIREQMSASSTSCSSWTDLGRAPGRAVAVGGPAHGGRHDPRPGPVRVRTETHRAPVRTGLRPSFAGRSSGRGISTRRPRGRSEPTGRGARRGADAVTWPRWALVVLGIGLVAATATAEVTCAAAAAGLLRRRGPCPGAPSRRGGAAQPPAPHHPHERLVIVVAGRPRAVVVVRRDRQRHAGRAAASAARVGAVPLTTRGRARRQQAASCCARRCRRASSEHRLVDDGRQQLRPRPARAERATARPPLAASSTRCSTRSSRRVAGGRLPGRWRSGPTGLRRRGSPTCSASRRPPEPRSAPAAGASPTRPPGDGLQREVQALTAEGRMSAYVIAALPDRAGRRALEVWPPRLPRRVHVGLGDRGTSVAMVASICVGLFIVTRMVNSMEV